MEAVHRYEGTVNQVMGDGIMALFGAPLAHEDHAVRACYAALDMQDRRCAATPRRCVASHGVSLEIRVGLNSGEVVVRAIGSDLRMDYTAVGQTTHLAARMEQLAEPGASLLTADTLRLAEGYVEVTPLGPVPVKGLDAPSRGLRADRERSPRAPGWHAAATRGLTRFVGRDAELEQLRQALGRAAAGHGQVVAIVGEPGVGKSRLVWEVTHSHRVHGWLVAPGRLGLVRQGDALPAGDRSAQGLLRDRGPGRPAGGAREGDGEAPDAGPRPGSQPAGAPGPARRPGGDAAWDGARPAAASPAHARRAQAAPAPREPGPAAPAGLRGPPLDRLRDPGAARRARREPAGGAAAAPRELPAGVPARLGEQDLLHAAPARPAPAGERRGAARTRCSGDDPASSRSSAC